jgi:hypothetical protein
LAGRRSTRAAILSAGHGVFYVVFQISAQVLLVLRGELEGEADGDGLAGQAFAFQDCLDAVSILGFRSLRQAESVHPFICRKVKRVK